MTSRNWRSAWLMADCVRPRRATALVTLTMVSSASSATMQGRLTTAKSSRRRVCARHRVCERYEGGHECVSTMRPLPPWSGPGLLSVHVPLPSREGKGEGRLNGRSPINQSSPKHIQVPRWRMERTPHPFPPERPSASDPRWRPALCGSPRRPCAFPE